MSSYYENTFCSRCAAVINAHGKTGGQLAAMARSMMGVLKSDLDLNDQKIHLIDAMNSIKGMILTDAETTKSWNSFRRALKRVSKSYGYDVEFSQVAGVFESCTIQKLEEISQTGQTGQTGQAAVSVSVEKASIEPVTKKHGIDELQERLPALLDATGCSWEQAARECLLNLTDGQLVKLLQSLGWVGAAREVVKKSA